MEAQMRSNNAFENGRSQASLRSLVRAVQRGRYKSAMRDRANAGTHRMRLLAYLVGLFWLALSGSIAATDSDFRRLYSSGNGRVVLTVAPPPGKGALDAYGKGECGTRRFCLIWFFADEADAKLGVQRMSAGQWFDPIPGLFAIYSKNKVVNEIICHEPQGSC
jgi:hypothetical protein